MKLTKSNPDPVRAYLKEIGRVPLLTHEEEILYAKRVQRLVNLEKLREEIIEQTGKEPTDSQWAKAAKLSKKELHSVMEAGEAAMRIMVDGNLRLVVSVAKKYLTRNFD